jgi:hypothetical protein
LQVNGVRILRLKYPVIAAIVDIGAPADAAAEGPSRTIG